MDPTLLDDLANDPAAPGISVGSGRNGPGIELTRAEWIERGRRFARRRVEIGVEPGDRVALVLPTGLPFLVALLGSWFARASVSPLCPPLRGARRPDPENERILTLLRAVEPRAVIAVDEALAAIGTARTRTRCTPGRGRARGRRNGVLRHRPGRSARAHRDRGRTVAAGRSGLRSARARASERGDRHGGCR